MQVRHPYALAAVAVPVAAAGLGALPLSDDARGTVATATLLAATGATIGTAALALFGKTSWKHAAKVAGIGGAALIAGTAARAASTHVRDSANLRDGWQVPSPVPPLTPVDPHAPAAPGDMPLGDDFLIGTTNSATQVEGGGIDNDITRWATTHEGWGAPNPGLDHWNRIEEDYAKLASNGHNAHGLTIDWARIEPREGEFDEAAIEHYRQEIETCRAKGMEPMVTLLQYAIPPWLADKGGYLSDDAPELFGRFAGRMAEELGDEVTYWKTMNEPNTLAGAGYLAGVWGPGETSPRKMMQSMDAQLRMHAAAANAIRAVEGEDRNDAKIGIAYIDDRMYPYQWWNPLDQVATKTYDYVGNEWFLDSIEAGRSIWPVGRGDAIKGLKGSLDFVGLNFYGRGFGHVSFDGQQTSGSPIVDLPNPEVQGDPAFDEEGLYQMTTSFWNRFHVPVLITESGVDLPEPDTENRRGRAIVDSLAALKHAKDDGVEVLGYLHWTDWDSPEWHDGWTQHYGLFGFDPETGRRWDKPAAATFEAIARRHAIPEQWLSADNRENPAMRDRRAAHEQRELRETTLATR